MTTPAQVVEIFARLAGDSRFEAWLTTQHADAVKYLVEARDPVALHRAQGKALFIDEMAKLLAKGKALR